MSAYSLMTAMAESYILAIKKAAKDLGTSINKAGLLCTEGATYTAYFP